MRAATSKLLVFEFNGTARSGKGSIVRHLASKKDKATAEETGSDYRILTKALMEQGTIRRGMTPTQVVRAIGKLKEGQLTDMVASRDKLLKNFGLESLHKHEINELVPLIAQIGRVRSAVKAGFTKRVAAVRDSGRYKVLLVDGRDLATTIRKVPATQLLLRVFVYCSPEEAALRECERAGIDFDSQKGQEVLASIKKRNQLDAQRKLDPVKTDKDVVDYWEDEEAVVRAVRKSRQLYFDTTRFRQYDSPKEAMIETASQIYDLAISAR